MIKRILSWIANILFLLVLLTPSISMSAQERRIALVIGNGNYKSSPLRNPLNDANDMAVVLKKLGFNVTLKTNADQRTMEGSIRTFGKDLRSGGIGLFYYAGHGLQVDGRNYLIPIGADLESEADVKYESVDAGRVLAQMENAENSLNIIILDACRDNPFTRSFRSGQKGLAKMDAPAGSILAYSTAPGSIAADGVGRNGLYTSYLLMNMMTPGLKLEDMFKKVRIGVSKESGKKQIPWESSSLMGDFYFSTKKRGVSVVAAPAEKTPYNEADTGLANERKLLEQELQELKRLKLEIEREKLEAERKRIETEKKKLLNEKKPEYASISPEVTKPKVIARDGTFIAYTSGVVYDRNTGLEWIVGPNRDTSWYQAKSWVESLSIDGGGWRMPTKAELKTLYQKGVGTHNMTSLLKTTGGWVWSGELKAPGGWAMFSPTKSSSLAWVFVFHDGSEGTGAREYPSRGFRGFAVRFRR